MYFKCLIFILLCAICVPTVTGEPLERSTFFIQYIQEIEKAEAPRVIANNLIFTYSNQLPAVRLVEIAFAHENFINTYRLSYNSKRIYFFVLPLDSLASEINEVRYRFIIDGIWTHDRANPNLDTTNPTQKISVVSVANRYQEQVSPIVTGRTAQFILAPFENIYRITEISGNTTFFDTKDELVIFVSGSFNGWDPYMLPLIKSERDGEIIYSTTLELADGVYQYYYVVNGIRIVDPHNRNTGYANDGRRVSVFTINRTN